MAGSDSVSDSEFTENPDPNSHIVSAMKSLLLILVSIVTVGAQTRTVTNSDLEKFKQERLKAEEDYRKNYGRLGMPSPEEIEKNNERRRREFDEYSNELRARREAEESSIIDRANLVRSQLASVNSQLLYLRGIRGTAFSQPAVYWSFAFQSYGYRDRFNPRPAQPQLPTNLQTVTDISRMYPNSNDVFNRSVGNNAFMNQRPRGGYYRGGYLSPVIVSVGSSNDADAQILFLEQLRAGLLAEWRSVEEEARRAQIRID